MKRYLPVVALLLAASVDAAPFLWANGGQDADLCVYTPHAGPAVESPVVVNPTNPPAGMTSRVCKIDLAGSPLGINKITLAAKSTALNQTSSAVPFTFGLSASSRAADVRLFLLLDD